MSTELSDSNGTEASQSSDPVVIEQRGRILLITLNRPEAMNAINGALADGLRAAIHRLDEDPAITVGVLTGAGRGFCAGMDLKAFSNGENLDSFVDFLHSGANKPLVAAVEGFALAGGLELALCCDLIVAGEGAKFGIPEVTVGLFAAGGALLRLPNCVGYGKAMEMAITGKPLTAAEAAELGLVTHLTEKGAAADEAIKLAEEVAMNAPLAVIASKALMRDARGLTEEEFWERQASIKTAVFTSNDASEGPRAFAEKRPPIWTGK